MFFHSQERWVKRILEIRSESELTGYNLDAISARRRAAKAESAGRTNGTMTLTIPARMPRNVSAFDGSGAALDAAFAGRALDFFGRERRLRNAKTNPIAAEPPSHRSG